MLIVNYTATSNYRNYGSYTIKQS